MLSRVETEAVNALSYAVLKEALELALTITVSRVEAGHTDMALCNRPTASVVCPVA